MLRIQSENNLDLDLHRHKFLDFCETNTDKKKQAKRVYTRKKLHKDAKCRKIDHPPVL